MRRPLIASKSPLWAKVLGALMLVFIMPVALLAKLIVMPFERPKDRSAAEVAGYLRDFLEGRSGDWDWDDFISIPLSDARLEDLRGRAAALELPTSDTDTAPLRALIVEAEAIAAEKMAGSHEAAALR